MKINHISRRTRSAFTLIEMIGVLAVIAILAAVLIPKVFEAINNSRVNNASMSCNTVKTAIADHYAKFGSLSVDGRGATPATITPPNTVYDDILVGEGFLDKPFAVKIGDGLATTTIRLDTTDAANQAPEASATGGGVGDASYNLDGGTVAASINKAVGSHVVHAVITGVNLSDARELNARIDGSDTALGEGGQGGSTVAATATDACGRVKYEFAGATTTVYVYLTHR